MVLFFFKDSNTEEMIQEAYKSYVDGEKAETIAQREEHFNRALTLYTALEKKFQPRFGNGKLYYNIANNYFQLGEYSTAVLYYYRALKLSPQDERVIRNLSIAQEKLEIKPNLTPNENHSFSRQLFFFLPTFSLPQHLQLFFFIGVILFLIISLWIWQRENWLKKLAIFFGFFWIIQLLSLGFVYYFSPIEAVVITSTSIYRDAGEQYAKASDKPILSGTKVTVIEILQEGKWLKIVTPNDKVGYVPNQAIRLI